MLSSLNLLSRCLSGSASRQPANDEGEGDTHRGDEKTEEGSTASHGARDDKGDEEPAEKSGDLEGKALVEGEGNTQDDSTSEGDVKGQEKGGGDVMGEDEGRDSSAAPEAFTSSKVAVPMPRRSRRESVRLQTVASNNLEGQNGGRRKRRGTEGRDAGGNSPDNTQGPDHVPPSDVSRRRSIRIKEVVKDEVEDNAHKNKRIKLEANLPGKDWTRGSIHYGDNKARSRRTWISPTRKIEFKYREDAELFEALRKKNGKDEAKAWVEYTKIRGSQRKNREVIDPKRHDEEMGVDVSIIRTENNAIGPGWGFERREGSKKHKTRWISPARKMSFRYRIDAELFESLRKKFGEDEVDAWIEYTKIKHAARKAREVDNPGQFDDKSLDVHIIRKNHESMMGHGPGPGWQYGNFPSNGRSKGIWISPTRKMQFRNRKDAVKFEALRQEFGTDEIEAWTQYTKWKGEIGERREVVACHLYDVNHGVTSGKWTTIEQKKWLLGLSKFGKDYRKIAGFIDTREYSQVKSYGKRYFREGGKIPTMEELKESSDEDSIAAQENLSTRVGLKETETSRRTREAIAKHAQPKETKSRRKSAPAAKKPAAKKYTYSLMDGITNKSLKQKRQSLPERKPSRIQPRRGQKQEHVEEEAGEEKPTAKQLRTTAQEPLRVRKRKNAGEVQGVTTKPSTETVPELTKKALSSRNVANEPPLTLKSLSKDDLVRIASFSCSMQALASFALASKQTNSALSNMPDDVYRGLFIQKFGPPAPESIGANINWSGKDWWDKVYDLKKSFQSDCTATIMETSVGVLRWEKEEAALFEDNPHIAPVDRDVSKGYLGLQALNNLPKPPNAHDTWKAPLLLHGDFEGIKVYDSANGLLSGKRRAYLSIGDEHGQVTALITCKFAEDSFDEDENTPCCFLGYDSGVVAALSASLSEDERSYHFSVERYTNVHNSKVSAMSIMSCESNEGHPVTVLLSACYGGQVFYYPHSMNPRHKYDLTAVPAFSNSHPDLCPILSMTSTTFIKDDEPSILVCTGDRDGSIRLWLAPHDLLSNTTPPSGGSFSQVKWYKSKGKHCVTKTKFINQNTLISGNNQGDIRMWDLEEMKDSAENNDGIIPGLTLRFFHKALHNGPVETAMNIGDVLLTSGGNDGSIIASDASSGKKLGVLLCHFGQETFDETTGEKGCVKSCVMGTTVVENKLISLCRDGVLAEWVFGKNDQQEA